MRYLTSFFEYLGLSCTSLKFYRSLKHRSLFNSFIFAYFFLVLIGGLHLWDYYSEYNPKISRVISYLPSALITLYPPDLILSVNHGELSINLPQPYFIPLSRFSNLLLEMKKQVLGINSVQLQNVLVIDTKGSLDDFESLTTYALLTKKHLIYYDSENTIKVAPLKNLGDFVLTPALISSLASNIPQLFGKILPFVYGFLAFWYLFGVVTIHFSYLLLLAFFTFFICALLNLNLNFKKRLQILIHLSVAYIFFHLLFEITGFIPSFPYMRTLILLLLFTAVCFSLKEKQVEPN